MINLLKWLSFALILTSLSSCAHLNPLSILKPDPTVELNANVGKNVEQEKNQIKVEAGNSETKQEAEKITNDEHYTADTIKNITQNIPLEYLFIIAILAGWAIPDPLRCYKAARYVVVDILNGFVVYPVKSLSTFILKLLGRGS